jgi:hypothetical protein
MDLKDVLKNVTGVSNQIEAIAKKLDTISGNLGSALRSNLDIDVVEKKIQEVEESASDVMKAFGSSREHILAIKANLVDSVVEVTRLGKGFDDIAKTQIAISESLGRNLIVNSSNYEKLLATTMVTGQNAGALTTAFKDVGFSISHIGDEMETVVNVARGLGVSAQKVSSQVITNIEYMNRFNFQNGVEGMAKMAAQATNLRISMKDTLYFAERVYNPESAIEMSAALQRLGVTQSELLDPLRLMDLSLNDPTELQNQIAEMTKSFVQLNEKGQFEIMPGAKLQLYEISQAMKIPYDTLTDMALGGAELEEKMSQIRFPSGEKFADDDTRAMIANLAEFNKKTGDYEVSFTTKEGKAVTKSVSELDPDDIEALGEASKPVEMIDLAKQQLSALERINNSIASMSARTGYAIAATPLTDKAMMSMVETYETITKNISQKFSVPEMRKTFTESGKDFTDFLETGETDKLKEAFKKVRDNFAVGIEETVTTEWEKTRKELSESTNEFINFFSKMDFDIEKITEKMADIIKIIDDEEKKNEGENKGSGKGERSEEQNKGSGQGDGTTTTTTIRQSGRGQDLVSYPGSGDRLLTGEFGSFSLDKRDMIVAGDPNKLMGNPAMDNLSMMERFMNSQRDISTTSSINQNIKAEGEVSFVIKVDSNNPNITPEQMERILEDRGVMDSIRRKLDEISTNIGRTSPVNPVEYNKNIVNQQYSNAV